MTNETNQSWTARMLSREISKLPEPKEGERDFRAAQADRRLTQMIESGDLVPPEGA